MQKVINSVKNKEKSLTEINSNGFQMPPVDKLINDSLFKYTSSISSTKYEYYILGDIKEPQKYLDLINTLKNSTPNDIIFIYINSPGGRIDTTIQILMAMKQCPATVITTNEGSACSAATFIFLAGHRKIIAEHSEFMAHTYSYGNVGKGNEHDARNDSIRDRYKIMCQEYYCDNGVLTEEELNMILQGVDKYFNAAEISEKIGLVKTNFGFYTDMEELIQMSSEQDEQNQRIREAMESQKTPKEDGSGVDGGDDVDGGKIKESHNTQKQSKRKIKEIFKDFFSGNDG